MGISAGVSTDSNFIYCPSRFAKRHKDVCSWTGRCEERRRFTRKRDNHSHHDDDMAIVVHYPFLMM